ncbi:hypothetical protein [Piscinibacter sp. HJYY11]|uniref:hypothetical protein n=1 Tax=Piscinibacter sp. HJYY11 TaxID=2801333 RepID=UPI00191F95D4|nr:hypothetical protein [Piscinibacter sp. HJYY11]MBL0726290.1 hypothetical protein [Piscinibacter sp. HJYY11]
MSMRAVFSVVSLLVVLAVAWVFAGRMLTSAVVAPPGAASAPGMPVQQQAAQIQEQLKQDLARAAEENARRDK